MKSSRTFFQPSFQALRPTPAFCGAHSQFKLPQPRHCWSDQSRERRRDRLFGLQLDATSDITHPVRVSATIINIYPLTTGVSTFYLALLPTYQHINLFPLALNMHYRLWLPILAL